MKSIETTIPGDIVMLLIGNEQTAGVVIDNIVSKRNPNCREVAFIILSGKIVKFKFISTVYLTTL